MNDVSKSLWGILFVVVGIILGLNALDITNINIFFNGWWTLFIIVPSLIGLFDHKESKTGNFIGLVIGGSLLFVSQGILQFDMLAKLMVPFIFVAIGVSFLFGDSRKGKIPEKLKTTDKDVLENIVATFSEQKVMKEEVFKGANLEAIFGGVTLDLRKANLEKETLIKASAIFGGITILLPDDVNVKVKATPIFGGIANKFKNHKENKKVVYIEAFCMFGGIDIK